MLEEEHSQPENITPSAPETPDYHEKWIRAVAECDNMKKRMEKEYAERVKYAFSGFAKDMIILLDHLYMAIKSVPESHDPLYQGVLMIQQEAHRLFEQFHIKRIDALGQPFNAHYHEVIREENVPDVTPHTIVEVLSDGYMLHDRLLRPAKVVVSV